jgi:hypothetical protein
LFTFKLLLQFITSDLSKKILKAARKQQAELGADESGPSPAKHVQLPTSANGSNEKFL